MKVVNALEFHCKSSSHSFTILEQLMMKRICDKLSRIGIAYLTSTIQCDMKSFLLPSVMPLIDLDEH